MSEGLIAQPFGNVGAHIQGKALFVEDSRKTALPPVQIEDFGPLPAPVEEQYQDPSATIEQIKDNLLAQLAGFEDAYAGSEPAVCESAFQHFNGIVEMIDDLYEETKRSLEKHLSEVQVNTIRSATYERACSARIDNYLKRLDPSSAPRVEYIAYALMNERTPGEERAEMQAKISADLELMKLLSDYECARSGAEKYTTYFKRLQDYILAYRNLKFWVREKISQSYARAGYPMQAERYKIRATYLGMAESKQVGGINHLSSLDPRFMCMYEQLVDFRAKYGHCDVPSRYRSNKNLAIWVANLRARRKRGQLSEQKEQMLNRVGFCWTSERSKWQKMFEALKVFIAENGHSLVPMHYEQCPELSTWIRNLRKDCRKGVVSRDKITQLTAIGFTFEVLDRLWFEKLDELRLFRATYGHCRVPNRWAVNPSLARWVHLQRQRRKDNSLPENRTQLLDELEFEWTPPKGRPRSL